MQNNNNQSLPKNPERIEIVLKIKNCDQKLKIKVKDEEDVSLKNIYKYVLIKKTRESFEEAVEAKSQSDEERAVATKKYFSYVIKHFSEVSLESSQKKIQASKPKSKFGPNSSNMQSVS
jgi:hypothetical protein